MMHEQPGWWVTEVSGPDCSVTHVPGLYPHSGHSAKFRVRLLTGRDTFTRADLGSSAVKRRCY